MAVFSALNKRDKTDFLRSGGQVADKSAPTNSGAQKTASRVHQEQRALGLLRRAGAGCDDLSRLEITDQGLAALAGTVGSYERKLGASHGTAARAKVVDHMLGTLAGRTGGAHAVLVDLGIHTPSKPTN